MDCTHASEVLSAAFDGPVPAETLAQARAHAASCPECADLLRALDALAVATPPKAPASLMEALIAEGNAAAARASAAEPAGRELDGFALEHELPRPRHGWAPKFTAFAAAAAVLLVALTLTGLGVGGRLGGSKSATDAEDGWTTREAAPALTAPNAAGDAQAGLMDQEAYKAAPELIVFGTGVYHRVGPFTGERSSLASAGVVYTTVGSTEGSATANAAYRPASNAFALVVQESPEQFAEFAPVTRRFAGGEYQMQSGTPIVTAGGWPTLPSAYAVPSTPDGAPTFVRFGSDDLGVPIFVPPGTNPQQTGFAVAPGTAQTDPAAGAPVWTWWQPLR